MSRVRVFLGCSLDGCIAGPEHDISFLHEFMPDPDAPSEGAIEFADFMAEIGALLMGRNRAVAGDKDVNLDGGDLVRHSRRDSSTS